MVSREVEEDSVDRILDTLKKWKNDLSIIGKRDLSISRILNFHLLSFRENSDCFDIESDNYTLKVFSVF